MCIINYPVESVRNTKLFVGLNINKTKQIVVYSNKISNSYNNNAMILPCSHPNSIQFHRMDKYKTFFDDLSSNFVKHGINRKYSYGETVLCCSLNTIPVVDIGSCLFSIVPTIDDFNRIDSNYFTINNNVLEIFKNEYPPDFGYIVCKLKIGVQVDYEPLAYSHILYEKNKVFIPTLHYHPYIDNIIKEEITADWSHDIYIMNCLASENNKKLYNEMKDLHNNYDYQKVTNVKYENINFNFDYEKYMTKLCINGTKINKDLIFDVD